MTKIVYAPAATGTGTITLSSPVTASDINLELPLTGTHLASAQADGMPLGPGGDPVVENGSNSDGEWVRWADGTQLCTRRVSSTTDLTTAIGNVFRTSNNDWVFPNAFSTISDLIAAGNQAGSPGYAWLGEGGNALTVTGWSWAAFCPNSSTATPVASLIATGRWK